MKDKLLGGVYGALIGDATGVPYEFRPAREIPQHEQIDMHPPSGWIKTYAEVPDGTWSDDGSLMLCLLEALLDVESVESPHYWIMPFVGKMINWRHHGYLAVDGRKFDIGIQTASALLDLENGVDPLTRVDGPHANGNGALMRALPAALVARGSHSLAHKISFEHASATHAHGVSKMACALYSSVAVNLLTGIHSMEDSWGIAIETMKQTYPNDPDLETVLAGERVEPTGSGYVVDSLWSAYYACMRGKTYADVIKYAIGLGKDTDTTACIAGGLAGIYYGFSGIPSTWRADLRGHQLLQPILAKLLHYHKDSL